MGAGVSHWQLARAVARAGQLGVVSGTALAVILARRLQDGDPGGHMRRALAHYPVPAVADWIVNRYFIAGGKAPDAPYASVPMYRVASPRHLVELTIAANFAEVFLAKEGHDGIVGINLLEKIQLPNAASLYGAMLAGVDFVLMGAGIPREIPGTLDRLAAHEPAILHLSVTGCPAGETHPLHFDPRDYAPPGAQPLHRPKFLAIIASAVLATALARKANGRVDGFIIESPLAGGHNAPPRGAGARNDRGEPVYGDKDIVDLNAIRGLGLPFWLAGGFASPEKLREARAQGAAGIQVGTAFALCEDSGLQPALRLRLLREARDGTLDIFTDADASPTGFPFKVARLPDTMPDAAATRERVCDLGYLRHLYRRADGTVGGRCPGEPEAEYIRKGGSAADTAGKLCLCNGLLANLGMPQIRRSGAIEKPLLTLGDDLHFLPRLLRDGRDGYTAADVVGYLTSPTMTTV